MRKPSILVRSLLLLCLAAAPAAAQFRSACANRVIRYDAKARTASLTLMCKKAKTVSLMCKTDSEFEALPPSQDFICDGQPVVLYVVNRRFKQDFSVNVDSTFQLSSGLPEIRGIQDATNISPPAAAQTPQPAATGSTQQAKGIAEAPQPVVLQDILNALLDERTFRDPLTILGKQDDYLRTNARMLTERFNDYTRQLNRVSGSEGSTGVDQVMPTATLKAVAKGFTDLSAAITNRLSNPTTRAAEIEFDRISGAIDRRVNDVKRLQTALQAYPAADTLAGLEKDTEDLVSQVRIFRANVATVQTAVDMVRQLVRDWPELVTTVSDDMLRADVKKFDTGLKDDAVNQLITAYKKAGGDPARTPFVRALPETLDKNTYGNHLRELANAVAADGIDVNPLRDRYDAARDLLFRTEVDLIDKVNWNQAKVFSEINEVYWKSSIGDSEASLVALDLGGKTGNLYVYYSVSVTDNFTPYQFQSDVATPTLSQQTANNSTPSANMPAPNAAGTPAPKGMTGSPAAIPGANAATPSANGNSPNTPSTPTANAGATTPPSGSPAPNGAKKVFNSYVAVHHFTSGTVVAGFAFSTMPSYSYALGPRLDSSANPVKDSAGNAQQIVKQTDYRRPQLQYIIGIDYYLFGKKDMFPDRKRTLKERFMPGLIVATSMTELNHYFGGFDLEPVMGLDFAFGYHYGKRTALQQGCVVDEIVPSTVTAVPTRSLFRSGFFAMIGFDVNIFRSVFGKVTGVGGQ